LAEHLLDAVSAVSYSCRVLSSFYYRFSFTYRFPYYGERAGETRSAAHS
jgi:hypothetical protein